MHHGDRVGERAGEGIQSMLYSHLYMSTQIWFILKNNLFNTWCCVVVVCCFSCFVVVGIFLVFCSFVVLVFLVLLLLGGAQ